MEAGSSKQVYLSYSIDESKILDIIDWIDELKKFNRIKKYSNNVKQIKDQIRKSDILIFFLTNSFLKSKRFKFEMDYANTESKSRIYVLMDENIEDQTDGIDFENFTSIKLIEPLDSEANKNALDCIRILLFNGLNINQRYYDKNMHLDFSLISINQIKNIRPYGLDKINIISNNEVIIKNEAESKLNFFNFITSENICEIKTDSTFVDYCWIGHLSQIFVLNEMYSLSCLFQKNGLLIKNISLDFNFYYIYSMFYNEVTKDIFFFCSNYSPAEDGEEYGKEFSVFDSNDFSFKKKIENKLEIEYIKFTNDNIYTWDYSELFINNLNFEKLASFELEARIRSVFSDPNNQFLVIDTDVDTVFFNAKNFTILGSFKHPYVACLLFNKNLVLIDNIKNFFIYKIDLIKNADDSKYTCKIDRFSDPHLLKSSSYFLPCGNIGCFDCICKNFNIYNNTFKCDFKSCQKEHQLKNKLNEVNLRSKSLFLENTVNIFEDISAGWVKIQKGNYHFKHLYFKIFSIKVSKFNFIFKKLLKIK